MTSETRKAIYLAKTLGDRVADWIATFVGSWLCVFLHAIWFTVWFVLRLDINLLTLIVSLEAIFLCIFLLMSQNRASDRDHVRDDLEAAEVDELASSHKLLHTLVVDIKAINERQTEILEALQPKSRKVTK